ncbi:MAG TPA: serine/threonine-protein kinase [Actinomycetota bacterium]
MAEELGPGSQLGGYRIESRIGRGGMGVVYLAEHLTLGRRVALKVVAPELVEDAGFRERFLREAQLAASLDHENIIPVYDAGDADGVLYLAMRYVEGENLGHVLEREGRLPVDRTLEILAKVAGALDEAHRRGLVHRDVKPDNVLLGTGGSVYLTDFGLVRRLSSQTRLTKTGYMMGTLNYMAPEIFRGQEVDGRTDVYSLACVLFECLTGRPPYSHEEQPAVISAHLLDPAPTVTAALPMLPTAIDGVVATGMAKDKDDRYPTCGALIDAATVALAASPQIDETIIASPPGPGPVPPPPTPTPTPVPAPIPVPVPDGPGPDGPDGQDGAAWKRWLPWALAGVAAVVAAILIVPNLLGDEPDGRTGPTGATRTGATGGTGPSASGATGATGATGRDPEVELVTTVQGDPATIDLGVGAVWVASDDGTTGLLTRVDASGSTEVVEIGRSPRRIAFTGSSNDGSVWTTTFDDDSVSRVDVPLDGSSSVPIPVGDGPVRLITEGTGFVWVANGEGHTVSRIDPATNVVVPVEVETDPSAIIAAFGLVWVANTGADSVSVVDPDQGVTLESIRVGPGPISLRRTDPFVVVANRDAGTVELIDPQTRQVAETVGVGPGPDGLTNGVEGTVWTRNQDGTTVSEVGVSPPTELRELDVRGAPVSNTVSGDAIWFAVDNGTLVRFNLAGGGREEFALGCEPVAVTSERDPSLVPPQLRGIWVVCADGAVLRVQA